MGPAPLFLPVCCHVRTSRSSGRQARLHRMRWLMWAWVCLQGEQWKKTTLTTALLYPGVVFAIFFTCNLLVWGQKSSGAGPRPLWRLCRRCCVLLALRCCMAMIMVSAHALGACCVALKCSLAQPVRGGRRAALLHAIVLHPERVAGKLVTIKRARA